MYTNSEHSEEQIKVVIVGSGFAGVQTAKTLLKKLGKKVHITMVSCDQYLTYYPAMYRFVTGAPAKHVAIPLEHIFLHNDQISLVQDSIVQVDPTNRLVIGKSGTSYQGDYLVLATGSKSYSFHIEGVDESSFNFKSFPAALTLRKRIVAMFNKHLAATTDEMLLALHFVIIGGGASGVELAGELAIFTKELARSHKIPESLVTIDLVERNDHLLGRMDPKISSYVEKRLRSLGVNLLLNRTMVRSESWTVYLGDMSLGAKTLIWTAGVQPSDVSQGIRGIRYAENNKIIVNKYLEAAPNFFVLGDIADTQYSGLAQAALVHGKTAAKIIVADVNGKERPVFRPKQPSHVIPVGPQWGVFEHWGMIITGRFAWWMRYVVDFKVYLTLLPITEVIKLVQRKIHPSRHIHHEPIHDINSN